MLEVAANYGLEPVILGGSSMGSASALYAAIQEPSLVSGLILMRPPTAWEERLMRKPQLMQAARYKLCFYFQYAYIFDWKIKESTRVQAW